MIKKTVTYSNLFEPGEPPITKDLYFHYYEEELIQWMLVEGISDLPQTMKDIVEAEDWPAMMQLFRDIICRGYGVRIGDDFEKDEETTKKFVGSAAYNALFLSLMSDEKAATDFFNGMFPPDLMAKALATVNAPVLSVVPGVGVGIPQKPMTPERAVELSGLAHPYGRDKELLPWAFREPTEKELSGSVMTRLQLVECMKRKTAGWEAPESL